MFDRERHYREQLTIMRVAFFANYAFGIVLTLLAIDSFRGGEGWPWGIIQALLALMNFAAAFNSMKIVGRIRDELDRINREQNIPQ